MKSLSLFAAALATALLVTGCANSSLFNYNASNGAMHAFAERGSGTASISVLPFKDQRNMGTGLSYTTTQGDTYPQGDNGSLWLGMIPLMPFGFVHRQYPEKTTNFVTLNHFKFSPKNDLAKGAALSLEASRLFSKVVPVNTIEQAETDYIWTGTVTNSQYSGSCLSYCVTYLVSPVFWILGLPSGVSQNELWLEFNLIERATGNTVWSYNFKGHDSKIHWIYSRPGQDASMYASLMKLGMNMALSNLNSKNILK